MFKNKKYSSFGVINKMENVTDKYFKKLNKQTYLKIINNIVSILHSPSN